MWVVKVLSLYLVVLAAAYFLPFDWWRKRPSELGDAFVGRLLVSRLRISLRACFLRGWLLMPFVLLLPVMCVVLPIHVAFASIVAISVRALRAVFSRRPVAPDEPSAARIFFFALLLSLLCAGLLSPARGLVVAAYVFKERPPGLLEGLTVGWQGIDFVVGIGGVAMVAFWLIRDAYWRLHQARQTENLATSKIRSMSVGLVELKGTVHRTDSARAPIAHASWNDLVPWTTKEQGLEHFYLQDDSGRVLVEPGGAAVRGARSLLPLHLGGVHEVMLSRRFHQEGDRVSVALSPGDEVYLVGTAGINPQASSTAVDSERLVVKPAALSWSASLLGFFLGSAAASGRRGFSDVFILTDAGELRAKEYVLEGYRTVLFWGFLWFAFSFGLVWSTFMPELERPNPVAWKGVYWRYHDPADEPDESARRDRFRRFDTFMKSLDPRDRTARTARTVGPALAEAIQYRHVDYAPRALRFLSRRGAAGDSDTVPPALVNILNGGRLDRSELLMAASLLGQYHPGHPDSVRVLRLLQESASKAPEPGALPEGPDRLRWIKDNMNAMGLKAYPGRRDVHWRFVSVTMRRNLAVLHSSGRSAATGDHPDYKCVIDFNLGEGKRVVACFASRDRGPWRSVFSTPDAPPGWREMHTWGKS